MKPILVLSLLMLALIAYAGPPVHRVHIRPSQPLRLIREIPWQNIAAGGAAAGTVVAAYKLSNGMEEGLLTVAKENPEAFIGRFTWFPTVLGAIKLLAVLAAVGGAVWLLRKRLMCGLRVWLKRGI